MTNTEKAKDYIRSIADTATRLAAMADDEIARVDLYDLETIYADLSDALGAASERPIGFSEEEKARFLAGLAKQ